MAEKKYYWLKMTDQFFEDKAIKKLRKIAGGDTYTIIYLKMLLTAIKQGNKMYFEGIEDDFMEELALELDEDTDNVKVTVSYLKSKGLIEVLGADEILLTQCAEMVGSETDAARRKRLQRDRERNRAIGTDPVPALEEKPEVGLSGPELSWVGEEGLEYIIPTVPGRRQRGISLWMQAGKTLGMLGPDGEISAHANGGAVGAGSSIIPEDSIQLAQVPEKADNTVWSIMGQAVSNESSKDASEGDGTTFTINNAQQNDGGGKVEVNVNMNPVIKIEGSNMDEEKIFQVLQNRIREMADDLGDEIAERMGKIFNNMPAVQEA